jgi:predicted tellurium resistance membrane protein TerC
MFTWISNIDGWIALAILSALEIVLGIDNIIFIAILVGRLPGHQRDLARKIGIGLAMVARLILLFSISWVMGLTKPFLTVSNNDFSGRDIILILGGLFLLFKATREIHHTVERSAVTNTNLAPATFASILSQIVMLDIIFSLDSVITAVGLVDTISLMVTAIIISVLLMILAAKPISNFVELHPTVKVLALSFLMLVGLTLLLEGFDVHVPKGYIYFAMAFSVSVEAINIKMRKNFEN